MKRHSTHPLLRVLGPPGHSIARAAFPLLLALTLSACGGKPVAPPAPSAPAPSAAGAERPSGLPVTAEQSGAAPQILTADLLQRQEVRADKILANWAIVGSSLIQSITINGEAQTFAPGDTVSISKEFILKIAQTTITVVATDSKGAKRELSYLIVNPGLPIKEPEIFAAPTKIAETKVEQAKQEAALTQEEEASRARYTEGDYTAWYFEGPLNQVYNREVRRNQYPVWMESRYPTQGASASGAQFRVVFRPLPNDVLTHRAYWGLTPQQYNSLLDDLSARGYQQVFREVLKSASAQWRIQTVWVLKAKR